MMKVFSVIILSLSFCLSSIADTSYTCEFSNNMKISLNYLDLPNKRNTPFYLQAELLDKNLDRWRKTHIYLPTIASKKRIESHGEVKVYSFKDDRHKSTVDLSPDSFDPNSALLIVKESSSGISIWLKGFFLRSGHRKRTLKWSNLNPLVPGDNLSIDSKEFKLTASNNCYET